MSGTQIGWKDDAYVVPNDPVIPYIEGDGIVPDLWRASQLVFDQAVTRTYGGEREIVWKEIFAGEKTCCFHGGISGTT